VLAAFLLCAAAGQVYAADDDFADGRRAFIEAKAVVSVRPTEPAGGDPDVLRQYPLYSYLTASRLRRQLGLTASAGAVTPGKGPPIDEAIAAFLAREGDRPVTSDLRREWLGSLAERRAWSRYLEHYQPDRDVSVTLRCHSYTARIALARTEGLADQVAATWLTPASLPDDCDAAIDWWRARGGAGPDLTERRARLALGQGESSLARYLARTLSSQSAGPILQWAALIERPAVEVTSLIAHPERNVEADALLDGWTRYARADAEAAAAMLPALTAARDLDERAASPFALSVAMALSWSRAPGALDYFRRVHADDFDERAHEWHVRAALWARDWQGVASAVAAMPEALRNQPRWRYWGARASEQLGEVEAARAAYASVIGTDNWYAVHSAARLGQAFAPSLQPLPLDDAEISRLALEPAFVTMRELVLCDLEPEAIAEWHAAYDALPPDRQLQAIGLAARWGWHMQAIAAAARRGLFNDYALLYPRPYDYVVKAAAGRTGLDADFIYAIIRQESLYRADAGSSAGALGLMQLLPVTARSTARRAGLPVPNRAQLLQPTVNVPIGASFLASLVERFNGERALATAAYNAGPNAARRWLPGAHMDLDVWVENIPFNETRAYVQRVAWHMLVFDWLEERKPRDVAAWRRSIAAAQVASAP
jgi:soluble lytic murein transglycosylase